MMTVTDAQLKDAFALFDKDQDGFISPDELGDILRSVGQEPTPAEIRDLLRGAMNAHGDGNYTAREGKIDFGFFCQMMGTQVRTIDTEAELKDAFRVLDKQGQGFIGTEEMRLICGRLGLDDMDEDEVEGMIREAISNYEGKIYYDGFKKILIAAESLRGGGGSQDL